MLRLRLMLTICSWLGRDSASKTYSQVVLRKDLEIVSNEVSDQPWKFQGSDAGEHSNRIKFRTWDRKTSTGYCECKMSGLQPAAGLRWQR